MTLAILISVGKWGGVYVVLGFGWRLSLGWVAITILPFDGDRLLEAAAKWANTPGRSET
jgi:hypothetical protein